MNRRIKKKKIKQRFLFGLEFLSNYCELTKQTISKECGADLREIAADINEMQYDFIPYLDCKGIDLMYKYNTGWVRKE